MSGLKRFIENRTGKIDVPSDIQALPITQEQKQEAARIRRSKKTKSNKGPLEKAVIARQGRARQYIRRKYVPDSLNPQLDSIADEIIAKKMPETTDGECAALCNNGKQCSRGTPDGEKLCKQHMKRLYKKVYALYADVCEDAGYDPKDMATVRERVSVCVKVVNDPELERPVFVWENNFAKSGSDITGCRPGFKLIMDQLENIPPGTCVADSKRKKLIKKLYNKITQSRSLNEKMDQSLDDDVIRLFASGLLTQEEEEHLSRVYFTRMVFLKTKSDDGDDALTRMKARLRNALRTAAEMFKSEVDNRAEGGFLALIINGMMDTYQHTFLREYAFYKSRRKDITKIIERADRSRLSKAKDTVTGVYSAVMFKIAKYDTFISIMSRFLTAMCSPIVQILTKLEDKMAQYALNKHFANYIALNLTAKENERAKLEDLIEKWVSEPVNFKLLTLQFAFQLKNIMGGKMDKFLASSGVTAVLEDVIRSIGILGAGVSILRQFFTQLISDTLVGIIGHIQEKIINASTSRIPPCILHRYFVKSCQRIAFISEAAKGYSKCSQSSGAMLRRDDIMAEFQNANQKRLDRLRVRASGMPEEEEDDDDVQKYMDGGDIVF